MKTPREVAIEAAQESGKVLLKLLEKDIKFQMKNTVDIQAEGDLQSEKIILNIIKQHFPDHSFLSEEMGEELRKSEYLWIIDPIDGTINFSRKIEEFCISIALSHKGVLVLGLIYQPILNKLYVAEKSRGSFLNGEKLSVSTESDLINCLAATDNSSKLETRAENFKILYKICSQVRHIRIFGSAALHLAKLAEGKLDFYYKTRFNYWDYAAGIIIIQEAGGKVSDFAGNLISVDSKDIIASNGLVHTHALQAINKTEL